ncbi:aminotransferase class I/II-fold pyridoxal phosphate-dependent enzyme [Aliikangiella coralliicola]|uniref:Aminotransferase n=1 Tax=Aliikangiella coralliicola TaxID=2592383 RepID=A0A545UFX8_9GAMM|nr:aminotransferase class I/II-fold pyridoxal phosphate-dependent enzyme [Aliikangiella coralliicola]TQV88382.1 aminotransferase class I/II-fold pyridoxal phosphate-dependent enzyme [Aliikangiella coralliicola]
MKIEEFTLERIQSLYENVVEFNLSDSGVHPYRLSELLSEKQCKELLDIELGYGWTNGHTELRQTIADLYQNRTIDNVMVTNGSAEANFIMVMSLLNPGDELIVVVPNYMQIAGWAKGLGIKVKEVPLIQENGWLPDLDRLEEVINDNTKMLTICHPNNPTGSTLPVAQIERLVNFAKKHDIYLHADEVYKGAEFDGVELPSFADLYDKAIVTCGLSKAMAMPGLRLGWLVGPTEEIYATWQSKDYTSITTGAVSEFVANIVLQPEFRQKVLQRSKDLLIDNLNIMQSWVDENSDWVSFVPPKAGGMAFIKYELEINSTELVHEFRNELSVFLLPGDVYGMDGYFRVGIGAPAEHLKIGLKRIADYVRGKYI